MSNHAYTGRLAFDPETEMHVDAEGAPVVTDDAGATWRYATADDSSHNDRYRESVVAIDSTANQFAELAYQHGVEKATELVDQHHFEVQPDDAHFAGIKSDPDHIAETITSHTAAYA